MTNGPVPPRRRPGSPGGSPGGGNSGGASAGPLAPRRPAGAPSPSKKPVEVAPKLVCTAGPKAGTEFLLASEQMVVGRAADADLSIPDTSVSRRHLEVRKVGHGWVVSDLGSGNGTDLNGVRITEESPLRNGDVLTLGDTQLSFVDEGNATDRHALAVRRSPDGLAAPPVRRPTAGSPVRPVSRRNLAPDPVALARQRKRKLAMVAALAVLAGVLFSTRIYLQSVRQRQAAIAARHEEALMQVSEIFQDGTRLVREGNWIEAQAKFKQVEARDPNYAELKDYLERAEKEIPNQKNLDAAAQAIAAGKLGEAAASVGKVTPDTLLTERLAKVRQALEDQIPGRLSAARADFDAKKYPEAIALTEDLLQAFPDNRDARLLDDEAKKADDDLKHPPPPAPPPPARPWEAVIARYTQGDLTGAVALANACSAKGFGRCKTLLKDMDEFADLNKQAENLKAKDLKRLLALDREISEGRGSTLAKNASIRAANLLYQCAATAKATGNWGRASECANQAIAINPHNAGAQAIVAEAQSHAKDEYMLGYAAKDTNPDEAIAKFREVMSMTPPGNEYHQKAQNWLEKLQRQ